MTVRSHMPGRVAIRTCSLLSNTRKSYWASCQFCLIDSADVEGVWLTTSSDMTSRLCCSASAAIFSSSSRVKTLPTGLCGVLMMIILVRDVMARLPYK